LVVLGSLAVGLLYLVIGFWMSEGELIPPLDDAYIFLQYGRTLAEGQPFRFNPADSPTGGVTSWLFTLIPALGFGIGLSGPMVLLFTYLVNMVFFTLSALLAVTIARRAGSELAAICTALLFVLNGNLHWGAFSFMDCTLFLFLTLLSVRTIQQWETGETRWKPAVCLSMLTLCRPEGMLFALLAWFLAYDTARDRPILSKTVTFGVPVLVGGLQAVVLKLITGSFMVSSAAKIPFKELGTALFKEQIEWFLSHLVGEYTSVPTFIPGFFLLFIMVAVWMVAKRVSGAALGDRVALLWAIMVWVGYGFFWYPQSADARLRYLVPVFALAIIYGSVGLCHILHHLGKTVSNRRNRDFLFRSVLLVLVLFSIVSTTYFLVYYGRCCKSTKFLHVCLGRWAAANLPRDAALLCGDVGAIGYHFLDGSPGRRIVDLIGLVSPELQGISGDGEVFESLERMRMQQRPSFFILYPDRFTTRGSLAGRRLFKVTLQDPEYYRHRTMEVWEANWKPAGHELPFDPGALSQTENMILCDSVDVADRVSEEAHSYSFTTDRGHRPISLLSERDNDYSPDIVSVMDGGRLVREERMEVAVTPGRPMILVRRYIRSVPYQSVVVIDGEVAGVWQIASASGKGKKGWRDLVFSIPGDLVCQSRVKLEFQSISNTISLYQPSYHIWVYQ